VPLDRWRVIRGWGTLSPTTWPHTVLVQACQHLGPVEHHGLYTALHLGLPYRSLLVPDHLGAGSRRVGLRLSGLPVGEEVSLSRGLRTPPLPATHATVGDSGRNRRLRPLVLQSVADQLRAYVSHQQIVRLHRDKKIPRSNAVHPLMSCRDACQLPPKPGHVIWIFVTDRNILPSVPATEFNTSSSIALIARALHLTS